MTMTAAVDASSRQVDDDTAKSLSSIAKAARVLRALALAGHGDAGVTDLASLGKSLLTYTNAQVVRSILAKPLPVASRRSVAQPRLLLRQLADVQASGVAYDLEESQPGVFCVATPVFWTRQPVAAVSVTRVGSTGLTPTDPAEVQRAAHEIANWLVVAP